VQPGALLSCVSVILQASGKYVFKIDQWRPPGEPMSCVYFAAISTILLPTWQQNRYCLLYITGHGLVRAGKCIVVWHKRAGQFHVSSGWAGLQNCWPVPSLLIVLVLVNAQFIMQIVFQLYDVLRLDSTVVSYVLINISSPKLNNQIFFNFEA